MGVQGKEPDTRRRILPRRWMVAHHYVTSLQNAAFPPARTEDSDRPEACRTRADPAARLPVPLHPSREDLAKQVFNGGFSPQTLPYCR